MRQPSIGLREAEIRLVTRTIKAGLPCLQLFPGDRGPGAEQRPYDRHPDIYDSFADMFTVLTVWPPISSAFSRSVLGLPVPPGKRQCEHAGRRVSAIREAVSVEQSLLTVCP